MEIKSSVWSENRFKSTAIRDRYYGGFSFGMLKRSSCNIYVFVLLNPDHTVYKYVWCRKTDYKGDFWGYRKATEEQRKLSHLSNIETTIPKNFNEGLDSLVELVTSNDIIL